MKNLNVILLSIIQILFLFSCKNQKYIHSIWIDEIPHGQIINYYGAPSVNSSFGGDPLTINGIHYERGLGTHAPSDLKINIEKRDVIFESYIGINSKLKAWHANEIKNTIGTAESSGIDDNVEYSGGKAIFRIYADDNLVYESPVMSDKSDPVKIRLKIRNAQNLRLITDTGEDGSFADYTNWAMARIILREETHPSSLYISSTPSQIMYNQAGYKPGNYKKCIIPSDVIDSVYVFNYHTNNLAYKNTIDLLSGDMGKYLTADFSELKEPGTYYLYCAGRKSDEFEIHEDILQNQILTLLSFLKKTMDHEKNSQHDDNLAIRSDNGKNQRITGGWYDTNGLRKSASSNTQLLFALSVLSEHNIPENGKILLNEEIEFLKNFLCNMQEGPGFLMKCTESIVAEEKDKENNTGNPENIKQKTIINTSSAPLSTQFIYSMTQARLAKMSASEEKISKKSIISAEECFRWALHNFTVRNACNLGAALCAACELYNYSSNVRYKHVAEKFAEELILLTDSSINYRPWIFNPSTADNVPMTTPDECLSVWPVMGLCLYIKTFSNEKYINESGNIIRNYCKNNITNISYNNAFSLIPRNWDSENTGNGRSLDDTHHYRLFNNVEGNLYRDYGNNAHITSQAAGLIMASEIIDEPELIQIAQNQLDWVLGCNPFNLSFITGSGHKHPALYRQSNSYYPPEGIAGGVMHGVSSGINDSPAVFPAWEQTTGYCIESLANLLWLTVLLDR